MACPHWMWNTDICYYQIYLSGTPSIKLLIGWCADGWSLFQVTFLSLCVPNNWVTLYDIHLPTTWKFWFCLRIESVVAWECHIGNSLYGLTSYSRLCIVLSFAWLEMLMWCGCPVLLSWCKTLPWQQNCDKS